MSIVESLTASTKQRVDIPGIKEPVFVRELLVADRLAISASKQQEVALLAACTVDESGAPIFATEAQAALVPIRYGEMIMEAINKLNGWSQARVDDAAGN